MQAIDFATYLCRNLLRSELTLIESSTLCSIAAGLDHVPDIADTLKSNAGNISTAAHLLVKRGLIHSPNWTEDGRPLYSLTPEGKNTIRTMLNFLPR